MASTDPARRARGRERRQSGRLTRRLLRQSLSGPGRKWIKEVWQAAEQFSLELSRLSPVTSPLGACFIDEYMAEHNLGVGEELHRALFLALVAGYSTRAVMAGPTDQPGLDRSSLEHDGLDARARTIATDDFASVMALPAEVWSGYVATATMKLQGRYASPTLHWHHLGRERIETMLRYGYVLRCFDEALGAEPAHSEPLASEQG
jgi:hypothetical protein